METVVQVVVTMNW